MESERFDILARSLISTRPRRGIARLLAGGALAGLLSRVEYGPMMAKKKKGKKGKKKNDGCPRGQKKDPYGICGFPPNNCLTVGALCSGEKQPCCSEDCRSLDEENGQYRCIAGKARCLVDFGCVPGYICRGYRCVPA